MDHYRTSTDELPLFYLLYLGLQFNPISFPWASAAKCRTHLIFSTGSLWYYLRATCHLFISVLVLCSHLNNCAKRISRCVVTCRQANANAKGEQSTWVMTIRVCVDVCVLCLEIKHWCEYAMAGIFIQSILPFSWISAGFELQPCTHLASHPTHALSEAHRYTHRDTEALPRLRMSSNPLSSNYTAMLSKTFELGAFYVSWHVNAWGRIRTQNIADTW